MLCSALEHSFENGKEQGKDCFGGLGQELGGFIKRTLYFGGRITGLRAIHAGCGSDPLMGNAEQLDEHPI